MNVALRLPDSLGNRLREFSKAEQISMNQFIATAIAEKLTGLQVTAQMMQCKQIFDS